MNYSAVIAAGLGGALLLTIVGVCILKKAKQRHADALDSKQALPEDSEPVVCVAVTRKTKEVEGKDVEEDNSSTVAPSSTQSEPSLCGDIETAAPSEAQVTPL